MSLLATRGLGRDGIGSILASGGLGGMVIAAFRVITRIEDTLARFARNADTLVTVVEDTLIRTYVEQSFAAIMGADTNTRFDQDPFES